jgi:hypothetical protein
MIPGFLAAQSVCPEPHQDADPLQIREAELTLERYREAVGFLESGLNEALRRHNTTAELRDDLSFWIQYANSVRAVDGYVLRQRAIYEGGPAVDRFCEFLAKSHWSD